MKLEQILKKLPQDVIAELDAADTETLNKCIVSAETAIADTKEELDNSPQYQELKENLKALTAGYKELKTYQSAKIQYALIRLKEK